MAKVVKYDEKYAQRNAETQNIFYTDYGTRNNVEIWGK